MSLLGRSSLQLHVPASLRGTARVSSPSHQTLARTSSGTRADRVLPPLRTAASADGSTVPVPITSMKAWDSLTERLVGLSAAPFSIIGVPQVLQNFAAISSGNPAALSIISWEGVVTGTGGNTLMSSHFAGHGETSALVVQLVSILNNFCILAQVAYTGNMPMPVFLAVGLAAGFAAIVNTCRAYGWMPKDSAQLWGNFQLASGIVGLTLMPQVVYSVLQPQAPSLAPAGVALVSVCVWLFVQSRSMNERAFKILVESLPGTAATLLFCLAPLPQLIKNFLDPSTLGGLSLGSLMLAIVGNSLMFPRALKTKDPIWLVGSVWANFAGWLTLFSLYLGKSATTGLSFLNGYAFAAISAVLFTYFTSVLLHDTKVKGNRSITDTIAEVFGANKNQEGAGLV